VQRQENVNSGCKKIKQGYPLQLKQQKLRK